MVVGFTKTVVGARTAGEVNNPAALTVPAVADQVTPVFEVPDTVAVNCCDPPESSDKEMGSMAIETTGTTLTVAVALLVASTMLVAFTNTVVGARTAGAVNNPAALPVPAVADQVTPVFEVPDTVAVNCCDPPESNDKEVGSTAIETTGTRLMVAVALLVASTTLVAFTNTVVGARTAGAVNNPAALTVPAVADQVMPVFEVPETVAVNC